MKVRIRLSTEYRDTQFVSQGVELPVVVEVEPPIAELSRGSRQTLTSLPQGFGGPAARREQLPTLSLPGYPEFVAPFLPQNPDGWDRLLAIYASENAARQAKADAQALAKSQKDFDNLARQVERAEARLQENEMAFGNQVDMESSIRQEQLANMRKWRVAGLDEIVARAIVASEESKRREALAAERTRLYKEQVQKEYEAERALLEVERAAWIQEHGSEYLRKACNAGYNCQRMYVTERAALERPGYIVDFDNNANWKSRACPSEAALDESLRVEGQVVWLTQTPGRGTEDLQNEDEYEVYSECEAVVIRGYLGNYDLLRLM